MPPASHHHRSRLKQVNKTHKDKTKPTAAKKRRGSSADVRLSIKRLDLGAIRKCDRKNAAVQLRKLKNQEIVSAKRLGGVGGIPPPKTVCIVAFHAAADALLVKRRILAACGVADAAKAPAHVPTAVNLPPYAHQVGIVERKGQRIILWDPPRQDGHEWPTLDALKVSDVLLAVLPSDCTAEDPAFDDAGYALLSRAKGQGLPSAVVGAVVGLDAMPPKKRAEQKKLVHRYFASDFPTQEKLCNADTETDVKNLVRTLSAATPKGMSWREDRGYIFADSLTVDPGTRTVAVTGYVRGAGFSCKHYAHLTGHGNCSVRGIVRLPDPLLARGEVEEVLEQVSAAPEEFDLKPLRPYDPTEQEQVMPTDEEIRDAERIRRRTRKIKVPKGMTSAAITDTELAWCEDASEEGDEEEGSEGEEDVEMADAAAASEGEDSEDELEVVDADQVVTKDMVEAEKKKFQLEMRSREDMDFPDEVDTPLDIAARVRFQKYRGLESFRNSPWDPYEELPLEYSRIWEFENYDQTQRAFKKQFLADAQVTGGTGTSGMYCRIILGDVPESLAAHPTNHPLILSTLYPSETKVSVMHSSIQRHDEYQEILASKAEVVVQCGFRRFPVRPVYAEAGKRYAPDKKLKYARFLHQGTTAVASWYGPIVFGPAPTIVLAGPHYAAWGSVQPAAPTRLVIKRALLTGYPFKTHKRKATVRFMFFDPDDIRWFKPVELVTKNGLRGHIEEPLGTHGYMKCRFNDYIRGDDTICLTLYKRQYPPWYPPSWGYPADYKVETLDDDAEPPRAG